MWQWLKIRGQYAPNCNSWIITNDVSSPTAVLIQERVPRDSGGKITVLSIRQENQVAFDLLTAKQNGITPVTVEPSICVRRRSCSHCTKTEESRQPIERAQPAIPPRRFCD